MRDPGVDTSGGTCCVGGPGVDTSENTQYDPVTVEERGWEVINFLVAQVPAALCTFLH